jgi:hypothetical protein
VLSLNELPPGYEDEDLLISEVSGVVQKAVIVVLIGFISEIPALA